MRFRRKEKDKARKRDGKTGKTGRKVRTDRSQPGASPWRVSLLLRWKEKELHTLCCIFRRKSLQQDIYKEGLWLPASAEERDKHKHAFHLLCKTHIFLSLLATGDQYTTRIAGIQKVTLQHPPNFSESQRCNKLPAYNALEDAPPLPSLHEDFQWHWIHHLQYYYFIKKQIKCLINSAVIEIMESASRPHLQHQVMKHFQAARKRKLIEARGNNHFYAISSGDSGPSNLYWSPLTCHSALTRASLALMIFLDT